MPDVTRDTLSGTEEPAPMVEDPPTGTPEPEHGAEALRQRVRQQEILVELGILALQGTPVQALLDHAARVTAEGLQTQFCKVLEYVPDQRRLFVRAGVGWGPEVVGKAWVGADLESPGGYALKTGRPVISNHLEHEERFRTPELLARYGIHRAMNVILQGDGAPFGVLEVDSRSDAEFVEEDIAFLQGAANLLGMAIERQRIETGLKAAIKRNEVLLDEVNHRVKNSLQLVASMLSLQAGASADEALKGELQLAAARVGAIAKAHQHIYRTDDVQTVDLGDYLRDICRDLDATAAGCTIHFTAPAGIAMSLDRAIPIALLLNELVTNAAKYAYPRGEGCDVWVTIERTEGAVVLTVRDHGRGLPEGFDPKASRGLGMRIVNGFAQQLGAALVIRRLDPGTAFAVTVPAA
jgi:two-component sensor histidine kinase